jgi:type I restriction enzyme S subunit
LRFQFDDDWKKYRISDLLKFFPTNSLSWEQLEYNTENLHNLHYGLIHKGVSTQINTDNFRLPNICEEFIPKTYTLCEDGDVAFADASEDTNDVAKAVEFFNCNDKKIVCGLHTIHGRDKLNITVKGFKGYAFSSFSFRNQIKQLAQGTKVYSVNQKNFNECFIGIPSKEEQTKIASLLQLVADRISTQSQIIEELKSLKKALCKYLLSNNTWKKHKVSEIAEIGRRRVISTTEINNQINPQYPVFSSQTSNDGIMGYLDNYDFEGEYITWTTDGANAGTVFYRNGKFNCTNVCGTIKLNKNHNPYFVAQSLQLETRKYVSIDLANPKLMNNVMASIEIYLPEINLQNSVSDLLQSIDNKINTEYDYFNNLILQKKYLLNQMFI